MTKHLEEAAVNWICNHKNGEVLYVKDAFIAGAEWQADHEPLPEDTVLFNKGVEEGKRLMMQEAVEKTICLVPSLVGPKMFTTSIELSADELKGFNSGDKVRVIVLPKED